jgi:hypothetical protein
MGNVVSTVVDFSKKIPVVGGFIDAGENLGDITGIAGAFFESFIGLIRIGIGLVGLLKEIFLGGIVVVKTFIDFVLDSMELLSRLGDLFQYFAELFMKYLPVSTSFLFLIPAGIFFYLLNNFIEIVTETF